MTLRLDRDGRDWPNRAASRFVEAAGIRWHVQRSGEGPTLLLLHGTGAASHSWRGVAPLLDQRFDVIAPDLPGHGFTGRPRNLSLAAMAGALAEMLRSICAAPQVVVGHSAGAAIAARMVLDRLVVPTHYVGLNPALLPFPGLAGRLFPGLAKLLFANPFAAQIFAMVGRQSGEAARFLERSTGSRIDAEGAALYARLFGDSGHVGGTMAMMADWDLGSLALDLPKLTVPTLLIHGDRDAAIPLAAAHRAAALIPGARLDILPGLGHLAHEERPAEVARLIEDFADGR